MIDTAAIPSLPHGIVLRLLLQIALLLAVARLGAEAVRRMGLPSVVGELAAGILLGPSVLGVTSPGAFAAIFPPSAQQFHLLDGIATVGMVLLLLLTGLETDLRLLRNVGRAAIIASLMGILVPFLFGLALGFSVPDFYLAQPEHRFLFSAFLATAMSISAMPVIAKILMDLGLTRRNVGIVILSAGVIDDTVGWLVLSLIAGIATRGEARFDQLLVTFGMTAGFTVAAVALLLPLLRWLEPRVARLSKTPDSDLVLIIVVALLCGTATEWIGIHAVFGAFVAGCILRQVPQISRETLQRLESFVLSVLAPLFFAVVGLRVDLAELGNGRMLGLVLGVATMGKLLGCTAGSLLGGLTIWEGLSIAVAMNARGAMELVVATIGLSLGILNPQMFSIIVVVALVTSFLAPIGLRLTMKHVRLTSHEARRLFEESNPGAFETFRLLFATSGGPNATAAARIVFSLGKRAIQPIELLEVDLVHARWRRFVTRLLRFGRGLPEWEARSPAPPPDAPPARVRRVAAASVAEAIVAEATKGFDVVFVGASHRGGTLGGEVLADLVDATPCHVAIVRGGDSPRTAITVESGAEPRRARVYVPFDGSLVARVAVELAVRFVETESAELVIGVVGDEPPHGGNESDGGFLARIHPALATSGVRPHLLPLDSDPASGAVLRESVTGNYDVVFIGAENRAIRNRLYLGFENEQILRGCPATVVVVVPNLERLRSLRSKPRGEVPPLPVDVGEGDGGIPPHSG